MNEDLDKIEKILGELSEKVDRLSKKVNLEGAEIKEETKIVDRLNYGIEDLRDYLECAKDRVGEIRARYEGKISENPLAYILGAFVGGIILGNIVGRKK